MEIIIRQSEALAEWAKALATAQGKFTAARKGSVNPHFRNKYADLASLVDACQGPLAEVLMARTQTLLTDADGNPLLETMLIHGGSGQWKAGYVKIGTSTADPQKFGSAVTYYKRYALAAMLGIPQDDDDDGEGANGRGREGQGQGQGDGGGNDRGNDPPRQQAPRTQKPAAKGKRPNEVDWSAVVSAGDFKISKGVDKDKTLTTATDLAGLRAELEGHLANPEMIDKHYDGIVARLRAVYDLQHSRGEITPLGGATP